MLSNEIKRLKMKKSKFENLQKKKKKKNPEIRHLPANHPSPSIPNFDNLPYSYPMVGWYFFFAEIIVKDDPTEAGWKKSVRGW